MRSSATCLRRQNLGTAEDMKVTAKLSPCISISTQNPIREQDVSFYAFLFGRKIEASG
jgi:hypothetical protein